MAKLSWKDQMTIKSLTGRQCSNRHIARLLGVSEGTVRNHRRRQAASTADGRSGQHRSRLGSTRPSMRTCRRRRGVAEQHRGASCVAGCRARLPGGSSLGAALCSPGLSGTRASDPTSCGDAPGSSGPSGLGVVPRGMGRRHAPGPARVPAQPVVLAGVGAGVERASASARIAVGEQRSVGALGRSSGHGPGRQRGDRSGGRGRSVGDGPPSLRALGADASFLRRCLPAAQSLSEGQGRTAGPRRSWRLQPVSPALGGAQGTPGAHRRATCGDDALTGRPGHRYRIPGCGAAVVSNSPWRGAEGSPRHRMSSCLHGLESGIHARGSVWYMDQLSEQRVKIGINPPDPYEHMITLDLHWAFEKMI